MKTISGFTMGELLIVASILTVIISASMFGVINVSNRAATERVLKDILALEEAISIARLNSGQSLHEMFSPLAEQPCRGGGIRDTSSNCLPRYILIINAINDNAGFDVIDGYPLDPWGSPYLIDQEEFGQNWGPNCPDNGDGIRCCTDRIGSAGPNRMTTGLNGGYDHDDIVRNISTYCSPSDGSRFPDQN